MIAVITYKLLTSIASGAITFALMILGYALADFAWEYWLKIPDSFLKDAWVAVAFIYALVTGVKNYLDLNV